MTGAAPQAIAAGTSAINPLLGAGIGFAGNAINQMLGQIGNRRQNHRMVEFWKMNNAYNHPSEQRKRLQEAGLNPALMYGQNAGGVAGNSPAPPRPTPPPQISIGSNPIDEIMKYKRFKLETDNLRAMNNDLLASAEVKNAQALKTASEAKVKSRTVEEAIERIINESAITRDKSRRMSYDTYVNTYQDPKKIAEHKRMNWENIVGKYLRGTQNLSNAQKIGKLRDLQAELQKKQLDFFDSQAIVNIISRILGVVPFK